MWHHRHRQIVESVTKLCVCPSRVCLLNIWIWTFGTSVAQSQGTMMKYLNMKIALNQIWSKICLENCPTDKYPPCRAIQIQSQFIFKGLTVVRCFSLCRHKFRKIDRWVRSDDTNINYINSFSLTHFTAGTFFDLFLAHYEEKMRYHKRVDPSIRSLSNLRNIHQRVTRKFFLDDLKPIFDRESFARRFEVNFF